jgi:hypothetical protein
MRYSSKVEDEWQRRATAAAIEAARSVVRDGAVPSTVAIGRLTDSEMGWIVCATLFGWIKTRAEQATAEGLDAEQTIRLTGLNPDPWDAGAVAAILPELAELEINWSLPFGEWPQETIVEFLLMAFALVRKAMIARDVSCPVPKRTNAHVVAREANAAAGNGLLAPDELNDPLM